MPRIRPLTRAESAAELAPILDQVERTFGTIHAGTGIFAYCPPILQASNGLGRAITSSGTLTPLLRSLATLRVAQIAGCPFRIDSLSAACRDAGASDHKIAAVAQFRSSDVFDRDERVALGIAEGMTRTPAEVTDAEFEDARQCFSNSQLVELAAAIASENYRTRFNIAFHVESLGLYQTPQAAHDERRGPVCPQPLRHWA
jgi:AhpD family alkylhydroperoxidase